MAANRAAFARWQVWPRRPPRRRERDLSIELPGSPPGHAVPALAARGDGAGARRRRRRGGPRGIRPRRALRAVEPGVPPMEEVAAAMGGGSRLFQLYWAASDELNASLLRRAEAAGCEAVVVTLDTHVLGWRTRDLDARVPALHARTWASRSTRAIPVFAASSCASASRGGGGRGAPPPKVTPTLLASALQHRPHRRRHAARRGRRARRAALAAPEGGGRDVPRRVLRPEPHVGRPRPAPRVDRPARACSRASCIRMTRARALDAGVDGIVGVEPRRPPGRSLGRHPRRAARHRGAGRGTRAGRASTAACGGGADAFIALALGATAVGDRPAVRLRPRGRGRGRGARGRAQPPRRARHHDGARRAPSIAEIGRDSLRAA